MWLDKHSHEALVRTTPPPPPPPPQPQHPPFPPSPTHTPHKPTPPHTTQTHTTPHHPNPPHHTTPPTHSSVVSTQHAVSGSTSRVSVHCLCSFFSNECGAPAVQVLRCTRLHGYRCRYGLVVQFSLGILSFTAMSTLSLGHSRKRWSNVASQIQGSCPVIRVRTSGSSASSYARWSLARVLQCGRLFSRVLPNMLTDDGGGVTASRQGSVSSGGGTSKESQASIVLDKTPPTATTTPPTSTQTPQEHTASDSCSGNPSGVPNVTLSVSWMTAERSLLQSDSSSQVPLIPLATSPTCAPSVLHTSRASKDSTSTLPSRRARKKSSHATRLVPAAESSTF